MEIKTGPVSCHFNVLSNSSKGIIEGVYIKDLNLLPDDRGFFAEIFRTSDDICSNFELLQASLTMTRQNVIKAFHYHLYQNDIFLPIKGTAKITLVDIRIDSPSYLYANSIISGERYLKAVRIPRGVMHGYEVLPDGPMTMVYFTDRYYDVNDEFRVPFNDKDLNFIWWGIENR